MSAVHFITLYQEGDVELRHQRNPDCVFDFSKPKVLGKLSNQTSFAGQTKLICILLIWASFPLGELTELKPRFLYHIIETLLPSAIFHPENNPNGERLLEL